MKKWIVQVEVRTETVGREEIEVEAKTADEAKAKALDQVKNFAAEDCADVDWDESEQHVEDVYLDEDDGEEDE